MAIEVYWGSESPYAWRVLLALEIKQIPYQSKRLSFSEKDLKSAEFLAINPRGQVPALRDGAFTLYESIAILCYLDGKHPLPPLFGERAAERGLIWRTIMECVYYLEPHMTRFAGTIISEQIADRRHDAIQSRRVVEQELWRIDETLTHGDYLAGDSLSAADIAVYPVAQLLVKAAKRENTEAVSGKLHKSEAHFPALHAWFKRIEAIPGYERTYPPQW